MTFEPSSIFGLSLDRLDRARVGEDRQACRSPKSIDTLDLREAKALLDTLAA